MQKYLERKKNPRGRHRENGDYLLTGKLRCGYCESFMVGISGTSKTGDKHYYYSCNGRRSGSGCKKENVRRDSIEYAVAALTQQVVFKEDVIEWIATAAVKLAKEASGQDEIDAMEAELAENRKATKNIMAAIEQGIFTATTKNRLLELEADIASLEQSIRDAKAISEGKLLEKERVVYFLTSLREGNLHSKTYQKRLIDTFVRTVYLWDDYIGIDYYYAGKDSVVKYSLSEIESDIGENIREVLKDSLTGHQKSGSPTGGADFFVDRQEIRGLCPEGVNLRRVTKPLKTLRFRGFLLYPVKNKTPCLFVHFTKGRVSVFDVQKTII